MSDSNTIRRQLTIRYVFGLSLIAFLAVAGQVLVQHSLHSQAESGREVNLAGRQRMLSQRIAKQALAARAGRDLESDRLAADVDEWVSVHSGLLTGDADRGLPGISNRTIHVSLDSLSPTVERLSVAATDLVSALEAGDDDAAVLALASVLEAEQVFLPHMDRVVFALDADTRKAISGLRWIEMVLLGLTLLVVVLVARFVFRPSVEWAAQMANRSNSFGVVPKQRRSKGNGVLVAQRWILVGVAVAVVLFWFVYRLIDPEYYDPIEVRLALAGFVTALLGLTFVSPRVRRSPLGAGMTGAVATVVMTTWLAAANEFDAPWTIGILTVVSAAVLAIAPYASTVGQVWRVVGTILLAMVVPLTVMVEVNGSTLLLFLYSVFLTAFAGVSASAQVHIRRALRERQRALEARERLLRTVIDAVPARVIVLDRDGRFVLGNEGALQDMTVETVDDIEGRTPADVFDPLTATMVSRGNQVVLESGEAVLDIEHPMGDLEGARFGLTSRVPLRDETGEVVGVVGLTRDVTEAKRARIEADEQRHLLRSVIDTIPDFITVKDRDGRCITRNIADARVIGYDTVEETIGLTVFDTSKSPELAAEFHADDVRVMETGEPVLAEVSQRLFGGGWKETTKVPLRDLEGEVIGLVSTMRDVTSRKESELELLRAKQSAEDAKEAAESREAEVAEQRRLLRTVIDTIPDHIYVKDAEGQATLRNIASARALGFANPDESVGRRDADDAHEFGAIFSEDDRFVVETGTAIRDKEEPFEDQWLLTTKVPLRRPDGEVVGLVGVSRDITAWKQAEAELREAKEAAESATRAKSEFLA
ncbi:PAS domain-containing protein, partial [Rubrivirga sp.]|uniref:PAS domain-containing protein n=1 Tax=Rubrivirga sp. TaxID=1885344 RepID=UPI003C7297DE